MKRTINHLLKINQPVIPRWGHLLNATEIRMIKDEEDAIVDGLHEFTVKKDEIF